MFVWPHIHCHVCMSCMLSMHMTSHIMYRDLADQSRRVVLLLATAQRAQHMWIQFVLSLDAAFGS
jgi:hypothetical protein